MKFTISWLEKHLKIIKNSSISHIAETLTSIGLEVEDIQQRLSIDPMPRTNHLDAELTARYQDFRVAQITEATPHPDAQKLRVCKVDDGSAILQVVCGAHNARAEIKVILAPIDTVIPESGMVIKQSKIRGVESQGMLCSASELQLQGDSEGIIELPESAQIGAHLTQYLAIPESIIEVALTPNRGDAASIRGVARDLYAAGLGELQDLPTVPMLEVYGKVPCTIECPTICQEFMIAHMTGVDNLRSLEGFESQLSAIGMGVKSPLVTLSNYLMMDLGRPNHIYDADKVQGAITVRLSRAEEEFIALGGGHYTLPQGIMVVADEEKVLAIAGVMGGELSKVDDNTTNILVEMALFCPIAVANAGRALNLLSESRYRFERRVDRGLSLYAISSLCYHISSQLGGDVIAFAIHTGQALEYTSVVQLDIAQINRMIGMPIPQTFIVSLLERLGFKVDAQLTASVPSHRLGDINSNYDIAEEVLRFYGLNNIISSAIQGEDKNVKLLPTSRAEKVRHLLVNRGFMELITYSFISPKHVEQFKLDCPVKIINPISLDMSVMRTSMLPLMLESAIRNARYGIDDACYFEIGNNFIGHEVEQHILTATGLRFGQVARKHFLHEEREYDFFDAKADLASVLKIYGLNLSKLTIDRDIPHYYHPGRGARVRMGKTTVAYLGQLNPTLLEQLDIKESVCAFEVLLSALPEGKRQVKKTKAEISNLQAVDRDFAFLMSGAQDIGPILSDISNIAPKNIESVKLFDIYQGEKIQPGMKSIAFSVRLRPIAHTFTEAEITEITAKIVHLVQSKYSGIQR